MTRAQIILLSLLVVGCQPVTVQTVSEPPLGDLNAAVRYAKAKLARILPNNMAVTRAELLELEQGTGIILDASPKNAIIDNPSFVVFLWPKTNSMNIAYETGDGAHTFRPIGSSENFRIYYSDPSEFMKKEVVEAFCTKKTR
ncbi:MAG: hypothetical protein WCS01_14100 [bacterium]